MDLAKAATNLVSPVGESGMNGPGGLVIRDLSKRFGATVALGSVGLHARRGEVHALLGENGAGKSTLIRIVAGILRPDGGQLTVDGRTSDGNPPPLVRTAFQELSLVPDLTVGENLLFDQLPVNRIRLVRPHRVNRRAAALMEALGARAIDPRRRVSDLALSDRQLIEVMKALGGPADVLVLDEPTSSLGPSDAEWVLQQARRRAGEGSVVLFVSHRMGEIRDVADRITVLRNGSTALEAPAGEADDDALISAMLGRRVDRLFPARSTTPGGGLFEASDLRVGDRLGPLSFDVRAGELFGLFALPNQGQRELLLGLAGAEPISGAVSLRGEALLVRSVPGAIRHGIILVPEDRSREGLFLGHSTQTNVTVGILGQVVRPRPFIDPRAEREAAAGGAVRVGLPPERLDDPVSALSGGNQQKAVLARALLTRPSLLLLHDCTRGVDVGTKAEIFELLVQLCDAGTSVIFYSSDITELVRLCDRVMVLSAGRAVAVIDRPDLTESRLLSLAVGAIGGEETVR